MFGERESSAAEVLVEGDLDHHMVKERKCLKLRVREGCGTRLRGFMVGLLSGMRSKGGYVFSLFTARRQLPGSNSAFSSFRESPGLPEPCLV